MRSCPHCGYINSEDARLCSRCSRSIVLQCPSCGSAIPSGTETCFECGAPAPRQAESQDDPKAEMHERMLRNLRDSIPIVLARKIEDLASKMVGQRRDVTVLAVSIANFTTASYKLGSETGFQLLDDLMHTLANVVYEYEGTIDKLFGDHLMALFGLPVNHENDPERAVRAALDMLNVIAPLSEKLKQEHDLDINIRIGINTGLVIAGNLGDQYHMEYTVIGDTVNLASQLENMAESGTALVSFRTYQRTQPIFNYIPLLPFPLKNTPGPMRMFRPLSVRSSAGQVRGLPGLQVPMVSRDKELSHLQSALKAVLERKVSQVVLLSGEAGIGKTRLLAEFRSSLQSLPVQIYSGSSASYLRITPYRVVAGLLRSIIQVSEVDPGEIQSDALSFYIEELNLKEQDILPYLVHIMGLPHPDPYAELRLKLLDSTMLQRQIHSALRAFLVAAARKPIILILEDLNWIDPASRDFLAYFIQSLDNIPIMLVLVARDFYGAGPTRPLVSAAEKRGGELLKIHLEPLSITGSRELIDLLLGSSTAEARLVKEVIINRAFGNPYFTEELVRLLLDNGGLVRQETGWLVTETAADLVQEVPGTLQDLILARFDFLPGALKDTLQRAAVLRSAFGSSLLRKISDHSKDALLANLQELEERGFLERTAFGREALYAFKHPLLQEAIYNTLIKRDLRPLHLRIAMAIESGESTVVGEVSDLLAYHYSESTSPFKAIPYLIASAEKAAQRFSNEGAVQYYRQALVLMESMVDMPDERIIQAQIGLARALKFTGDFEESQRLLENSLERLKSDGMQELLANNERAGLYVEGVRELADLRTREGQLELAIQLLQQGLDFLSSLHPEQSILHEKRLAERLAWAYFRQGKLSEAFSLASQTLAGHSAWSSEDPITLASLYNTLGGIYWTRSSYKDAIDCVSNSLEVYRDLGYTWGMAIAYTNLGVLQHSAGKWPEAIANLEQADLIRAQNGYLHERPTNLKNLGEALICSGDFDQARYKLETSLAISKRLGMNLSAAWAEVGLCRLAIMQRNPNKAQVHLRNAGTWLGPAKDELDERSLELVLLQALIYGQQGDYQTGLELAKDSYEMASQSGFTAEINEALWVLGIMSTGLGHFATAESYFDQAIRLSQERTDRYLEAQSLLELGQMRLHRSLAEPAWRQPLLAQARQALSQAVELFTVLGSKRYLERAQASLAQVPYEENQPAR